MKRFAIIRSLIWFDLFVVVFLATAAVGLWAAYDRETAWIRFSPIVAAALLYVLLTGLPKRGFGWATGLLGVMGAGVAGLYLLGFDIRSSAYDFELLRRIAFGWLALRPDLPLPNLLPNVAGGILALLAPFALAWGIRQRRNWPAAMLAALLIGLITAGLVMTSSRGAWVSLAVGLVVWVLYEAVDRLRLRFEQPRLQLLVTGLLVAAVLGAGFLLAFLGRFGRLPGQPTAASRVDLASESLHLIFDYPYIGAGLGSFPGVYSQYIRKLPFFQFKYSHNLYLDVAIEQGIPALLALLALLSGSIWQLLRSRRDRSAGWLGGPLLAGLITLSLHGLVDDALYANAGAPLLFLIPALAVAWSGGRLRQASGLKVQNESGLPFRQGLSQRPSGKFFSSILLLFILGLTGLVWYRPLLGRWYANLGAVEMGRVELADFPSGKWKESVDFQLLAPALDLFGQALQVNPNDQTAHYRLGLIELQADDFETAVEHLEAAYRADPGHRGIRKALGQAYTWAGQPDLAFVLLTALPESATEMYNYGVWWQRQGRTDLALAARQMSERLK